MSNIKSQLTERQKLQDQLIKLDESIAANAGKELAGIFNDALEVLQAIPAERQNATLTKSPVKEAIALLGLQVKHRLNYAEATGKTNKSTYDASKPSKTAQETYAWLKGEPAFTHNKKSIATFANVSTITMGGWLEKEPFKGNYDTKPKGTSTVFKVK